MHARRIPASIGLILLVLVVPCAPVSLGLETIWIEGESPVDTDFKWKAESAEKGHLLSDRLWLVPETRAAIPDSGWTATYEVAVETPGSYNLWARVGFEWIRPTVAWSVDDGPWTTVGIGKRLTRNEKEKAATRPPTDVQRPTVNVMELGYWCEAAWWHLGDVTLTGGAHRLRLKFLPNHLDNPMPAVDVVALVSGDWTPHGTLKPGKAYTDAEDLAARSHVFELPAAAVPGDRRQVELTGLWQISRYDDYDMSRDPYKPVTTLPAERELAWMGVEVPGSIRGKDELGFAHRVIYRTRVRIPDDGPASYRLHFSGTNWIVSVFVNGKLAGTHTEVWIPWDLDVTDVVSPDSVNRIDIAVKGPYYAIDDPDPGQKRNVPWKNHKWTRWVAPIYPSTKGDGNGLDYGLVNPVTLVASGPVYVSDVFVKSSVARRELVAEIALRNVSAHDHEVVLTAEAVHDRTHTAEKRLSPLTCRVPGEGSKRVTLKEAWADAKLWWPESEPHLYRLVTRIESNGRPMDHHGQTFGFREITWDGPAILINGVRRNFWNWVDVSGSIPPDQPEQWAERWRQEKNRCMRFSHGRKITRALATREKRLDFYDRHGIAGRLCSMIDGMFINYTLVHQRGDGRDRTYVPNERVWKNFRQHVARMTRAYRNHPSVIFYQIENELVYINGMNIYGAALPLIEREMLRVYEAGRAHDPTRPYSVGGGGDLSKAEGLTDPAEALQLNCPHYPAGDPGWYPENAYTIERYASKIRRWPWTRRKPWVVGESLYAKALELGSYAAGSIAFRSQDDANRAKARFLRMVYGGYRWAGVAGFFPWDNLSGYRDADLVFSDIAIIPRKQTHRFYAGRENTVHLKIMNDTFSEAPVTFTWSYHAGKSLIASGEDDIRIVPGYGEERRLLVKPPVVTTRLNGTLRLRATHPDAEAFVDKWQIPVLPVIDDIELTVPISLLDRQGALSEFLKTVNVEATRVETLDQTEESHGILLIGPDSLTASEALGQDLLAFAARGGRVIVLEQEHPAAGSNLSASVTSTRWSAGYAHPQALDTPLFRDLGPDDLIDWAGGHPVCKNVYRKPDSGARSLVECGPSLPYSALLDMAVGQGVLVLCQLRVGGCLGSDPAADILLRNLLEHYGPYRPPEGEVALLTPAAPQLAHALDQTGAIQTQTNAVADAIGRPAVRALVVDATRDHVSALLSTREAIDAFHEKGGWTMLCGVRPESIDAVNDLLGARHLLRPFRIERVHTLDRNTPLAATISNADLMLYDSEWIARWAGKRWVSGDTFSYVIDGDDAAPFTYPPGAPHQPYTYTPRKDDKDPYNFVNGMLNSDFWKYIRQIWIDDQGPQPLTFTVRKPETLEEIQVWNNANYSTIHQLDIVFDGNREHAVNATLPDGYDMTTIPIAPPRTVKETITLQVRSVRTSPHNNPNAHRLYGIDNVRFIRTERPSDGIFLDNVGGLVVFERGRGGFMINQIAFKEDEAVPENQAAKVRLFATLLRNMGVGSITSTVPVPGVNVRFDPVDLTNFGTHYLSERNGRPGWFGPNVYDLRTLPLGENRFDGGFYHVIDYATAPIPDCIVLGGLRESPKGLPEQITDIPVGRKADAMYFLHAAHVTRPLTRREIDRLGADRRPSQRPEVARYILNYDDGTEAVVPVLLGDHVDHWLCDGQPEPLRGAVIAWTHEYEAPRGKAKTAVLYSMQAPNPHPDRVIRSVDILPGLDEKGRPVNRAVPAVVAISTGTLFEP